MIKEHEIKSSNTNWFIFLLFFQKPANLVICIMSIASIVLHIGNLQIKDLFNMFSHGSEQYKEPFRSKKIKLQNSQASYNFN